MVRSFNSGYYILSHLNPSLQTVGDRAFTWWECASRTFRPFLCWRKICNDSCLGWVYHPWFPCSRGSGKTPPFVCISSSQCFLISSVVLVRSSKPLSHCLQ
jgi:hypothetical protein